MELIKIDSKLIREKIVETVNARDLHAFLENGDEFTHWIADRVTQFQFTESIDFIVVWEITQTIDKDGYPRASKRKEYALTLDMAKELSMVERNAKGKQARQYFIECERKAKEMITPPSLDFDPGDPRVMLAVFGHLQKTVVQQKEQIVAQAAVIAEQQVDVEALDRIANAEGSECITNAAKILQVGFKDLRRLLLDMGWVYIRPGTTTMVAYQDKINQGLLEHKMVTYGKDKQYVTTQARITNKGISELSRYSTYEQLALISKNQVH
jgi:anti-repressor protein